MGDLVSVVIPCFNHARYLERSVASVVGQSYEDWECVIVDDGSTDATPEVCRRLAGGDSRVSFLRQSNAGLSTARNAGIRRAKGELIQLLDADDLLQRHKLRTQVRYLAGHPSTDIAIGPAAFFRGSPERIRSWARSGVRTGDKALPPTAAAILAALVAANIWVVHAALVRRRVFDEVGLFDESLRAYEDWDLWLRCALADKTFSYICDTEDLALVREHESNMSANRAAMARAGLLVRERIQPRLTPELKAENAEGTARLELKLAVELIRDGNTTEGWRLFKMACSQSRAKLTAIAELAALIPGAFQAVRLGRRIRARWRTSASGR